jgi:hypothetical protein
MRKTFQLIAVCGIASAAGCFPTFQTARIDPGFRLEASAIVLGDQPRHGVAQGNDIIAMLAPSYAFNRHVEIGVPVGLYAEEGLNSGELNGDKNAFLVMPYLKFGFLPSESRHHLALILQSALILPANVGLRYGRDFGSWEPHIGANVIFSGGEAGDDPTITRYQERNQTMVAFSAGATVNRWRNAAFEIGVLRNQYEDVSLYPPGGGIQYSKFTYYDLFAGMRFNLIGGRR